MLHLILESTKEKSLIDNELVILKKPDSELDDLLSDTKKAERRINRKIDGLEIDVVEVVLKSINKIKYESEGEIANCKKKSITIIDNAYVYTDNLHRKVVDCIKDLERSLNRNFDVNSDNINRSISNLVNDFINDIDEIADKYLEEFEYNDYIKQFKRHFLGNIVNIHFRDLFEQREEYSYDSNFLDKALNFVDDLTLGILGTYSNALNTIINGKSEVKEWIDEYFSLIDLERIHKEVVNSSTNLIELIKTDLINDFVQPIIQKTEEIIANKDDIENRIKEL